MFDRSDSGSRAYETKDRLTLRDGCGWRKYKGGWDEALEVIKNFCRLVNVYSSALLCFLHTNYTSASDLQSISIHRDVRPHCIHTQRDPHLSYSYERARLHAAHRL